MIADFRLSDQLTAAVLSFALGAVFGFLFDVIRFVRLLVGAETTEKESAAGETEKRVRIFRCSFAFALDVVLSLLFTVCFCILSYVYCCGMTRTYTLFSALAGFAFYRRFPGRVTSRAAACAARIVRSAAGKLALAVLRPARFVLRRIARLFRSFSALVSRRKLYLKRKRFTRKITARLGQLADLTSDVSGLSAAQIKTSVPGPKGGKGSEKRLVEHNT